MPKPWTAAVAPFSFRRIRFAASSIAVWYASRGEKGTAPKDASLRKAMDLYEKAEAIRPHGNYDAILRWNTCARLCAWHRLRPEAEPTFEPALAD